MPIVPSGHLTIELTYDAEKAKRQAFGAFGWRLFLVRLRLRSFEWLAGRLCRAIERNLRHDGKPLRRR